MKQLTKDIIDAVSLETGIAPSYIEKDRYLVSVLSLIQQSNNSDVKVVFAGGTSLSKGYDLIHRFSEDVDFSIVGFETTSSKMITEFGFNSLFFKTNKYLKKSSILFKYFSNKFLTSSDSIAKSKNR